MVAVLPSDTQEWKNEGATETPSASAVIPVPARSALDAITRNVPNNNTNNCWVWLGSDNTNLKHQAELLLYNYWMKKIDRTVNGLPSNLCDLILFR